VKEKQKGRKEGRKEEKAVRFEDAAPSLLRTEEEVKV